LKIYLIKLFGFYVNYMNIFELMNKQDGRSMDATKRHISHKLIKQYLIFLIINIISVLKTMIRL